MCAAAKYGCGGRVRGLGKNSVRMVGWRWRSVGGSNTERKKDKKPKGDHRLKGKSFCFFKVVKCTRMICQNAEHAPLAMLVTFVCPAWVARKISDGYDSTLK